MGKSKYYEEVVVPGDLASRLAYEVCRKSYGNSSAVRVVPRQAGNFRGAVDFVPAPHVLNMMAEGKMAMTLQNDGAGGKPQFFTLVNTPRAFSGLGWEIIAMCADDIARFGGFPAIMENQIDAKRITKENLPLFRAMMQGYGKALKAAGLINITGEIAVMKHSITAFCDNGDDNQLVFTWSGGCLGLVHKDKVIDGSKIEPKMPIVGFREPGYRCNGGTFFTNLLLQLARKYGLNLSSEKRVVIFAKKLIIPSKSYAKLISRVHGWKPDGSISRPLVGITGIAHITGGGIWGKLGDLLPEGVGAVLDNMPAPASILREAQEFSWGHPELKLTDLQAYGTFHGGCGMLVVCRNYDDAGMLIEQAKKEGVRAMIVGHTFKSPIKEIWIKSRFKERIWISSEEIRK